MRTIAQRITARRWSVLIAILAILLSGSIIGVLGQAERTPTPLDALPRGYDSTAAAQLAERLPDTGVKTAVVVFSRDGGTCLSTADLAEAGQRVQRLPGATRAPLLPSKDCTAAIGLVQVDDEGAVAVADAVGTIRDTVKAGLPDGVRAAVTGPAAIEADLAAVFNGANVRLLLATASVVAILLVATYRSPLLWLIPLLVVGLADQVAAVAATRTLAAFGVTWDESTVGILSVLVFGAGTNYALLMISRYRDELRRTPDRRQAMVKAWIRTVEAVSASAITVFVGLMTLLLSVFPATRGLGLASAVGVVVAASFVLLVLPATLVIFGRWIFWPKVPKAGQASIVDSHSVWRRVGDAVAVRPAAFVVGTLVLLALAASALVGVKTGLDTADQFLDKPEAIVASQRLSESFPAGTADPARIVTTADPQRVLSAVRDAKGVAEAKLGVRGDGVTQIDAVLEAAPGSDEATQGVDAVRAAVAGFPQTHVGGTEAAALDAANATSRDRLLILPVLLALVTIALIAFFRSLVAPLVLVLTVVATYLASLGLGWLVFTRILGFEALDSTTPLFAFVFLVALGVDYNIFLVTRAREEAKEHGARLGMLRGLAATGGVITSAGILLAAVFAVLGVLPLVALAQLGTIICIGVLLDTLLVRTVLVPAIALLLGDRFWWPRTPDRPTAGHDGTDGTDGLAPSGAGASLSTVD